MMFRIQYIEVLDTSLAEHVGDQLGFLDGNGTYQHRLSLFMSFRHRVHDGFILAVLRGVYGVFQAVTNHRLVGRDHHNVHVVDVAEFSFFRFGGTCHAGQLLVHTEVVLQSDGRQGFRLGAD